jgi:outer membrane protein TolC
MPVPLSYPRPRVLGGLTIALLLASTWTPDAAAQVTPAPSLPAAAPVTGGPQAPAGPALALSMDQAVTMALEANLGLRADRAQVDIASHAVAAARASFLPQVTTAISRSSSRSVPQDFTQGAADITSQGLVVNSAFNHALPTFGTRYDLSWNSNRNSQLGGNPLFNPSMRSSFAINVTQPLWRGLTIDPNRAALRASEGRRAVADVQLQQQIVRMEATVRSAYLDLISAHEALRVAQQNMDVRQRSLADARARVAVGAAAPIDVISAEADVASNQEQVLLAEAQIATREDALRALALDPARPDYWQVRIVPTDTIVASPPAIDVDAAIKRALANRYDLIVGRRNLEIDDLLMRAAQNATRPGVDLRVTYGTTGTGGTRFTYGEGFPPPVVSRSDKGFGAVLGDTFGAAYPQWSVGLNLSYPIGQSAAEASYAQQVVARRQASLTLEQLELAVVQQVREAARQVENSYQRVVATQAALRASEQQFEAEQRRFAAGLATTLELQVRQGQLATARTAGLNAAIAHQRALIEFDRVQKSQ